MADTIYLTIALAGVLFGLLSWFLFRARSKRLMKRLDRMLDAAIDGTFEERVFDESMLSSVETKLAHYLSASVVSSKNLAGEREKIKTLIGDISHQSKTPLANILLYTQLLEEQDLPQESRELVSALGDQGEKLRFLMESLIKTSRLETGVLTVQPRTAALQPVLEEVLEQASPKAQAKGIALHLEPTRQWATFDPKWTGEALYNLLDNGIKYTPAGGRVSLRVQQYELFSRVDVSDSGMGIPEAEQSKIFARFYRSPAVGDTEGVGIGLYLVRQIAAAQGGYVKVASRPGEGATFSLFLPREGRILQN